MIESNFINKCKTCKKEIASCDGISPLYAEDILDHLNVRQYPSIHPDTILWCGEYDRKEDS